MLLSWSILFDCYMSLLKCNPCPNEITLHVPLTKQSLFLIMANFTHVNSLHSSILAYKCSRVRMIIIMWSELADSTPHSQAIGEVGLCYFNPQSSTINHQKIFGSSSINNNNNTNNNNNNNNHCYLVTFSTFFGTGLLLLVYEIVLSSHSPKIFGDALPKLKKPNINSVF